jgi:hypothetical protein
MRVVQSPTVTTSARACLLPRDCAAWGESASARRVRGGRLVRRRAVIGVLLVAGVLAVAEDFSGHTVEEFTALEYRR